MSHYITLCFFRLKYNFPFQFGCLTIHKLVTNHHTNSPITYRFFCFLIISPAMKELSLHGSSWFMSLSHFLIWKRAFWKYYVMTSAKVSKLHHCISKILNRQQSWNNWIAQVQHSWLICLHSLNLVSPSAHNWSLFLLPYSSVAHFLVKTLKLRVPQFEISVILLLYLNPPLATYFPRLPCKFALVQYGC